MSSSRSSKFMLTFMFHFMLIFVYSAKYGFNSFKKIFAKRSLDTLAPLLWKLYSSVNLSWHFCQKSIDHLCMNLFLNFLPCFIDLNICLLSPISWLLWIYRKSWSDVSSPAFFFSKIFWLFYAKKKVYLVASFYYNSITWYGT